MRELAGRHAVAAGGAAAAGARVGVVGLAGLGHHACGTRGHLLRRLAGCWWFAILRPRGAAGPAGAGGDAHHLWPAPWLLGPCTSRWSSWACRATTGRRRRRTAARLQGGCAVGQQGLKWGRLQACLLYRGYPWASSGARGGVGCVGRQQGSDACSSRVATAAGWGSEARAGVALLWWRQAARARRLPTPGPASRPSRRTGQHKGPSPRHSLKS
jgi:hypothetical protein